MRGRTSGGKEKKEREKEKRLTVEDGDCISRARKWTCEYMWRREREEEKAGERKQEVGHGEKKKRVKACGREKGREREREKDC